MAQRARSAPRSANAGRAEGARAEGRAGATTGRTARSATRTGIESGLRTNEGGGAAERRGKPPTPPAGHRARRRQQLTASEPDKERAKGDKGGAGGRGRPTPKWKKGALPLKFNLLLDTIEIISAKRVDKNS